MKKPVLDEEEKDLLDSYERGEWEPVKNSRQEIKKLSENARDSLQKDKRINIRMLSEDLDQVLVIADQEGIPYQTLISSVIHKYVSGYLLGKKRCGFILCAYILTSNHIVVEDHLLSERRRPQG